MTKRNDKVDYKVCGVWNMYPDPEVDAISPRWWHKLLFWKKWNYGEWKIKREYKKLSDLVNNTSGK